jgi:hypothetical protein
MAERLKGELPVAYLFGPSGVRQLLPVVISNPGMYQPVKIVDVDSNEKGSLFIQLAIEDRQKYLKFTEFSDEAIYDLFKDQFGSKAIRIEETLGFKVKF